MLSHKEVTERREASEYAEKEQRRYAVRDQLCIEKEGGWWEDEAKESRAKRPKLSVDLVSGALDQAQGDQRETETTVEVVPKKGGTKDLAKIYTGLLRNIEDESNAQDIYDCAYYEQLAGGIGGWRILTEEDPDNPFIQRIVMKWVPSAASSLYGDPDAESYTREDGEYWFVSTYILDTTFKKLYPKAKAENFFKRLLNTYWYKNNKVQVNEFWYKDSYKKKVALLSDGRVIDVEDESKVMDELAASGVTVVDEKTVDSHKVKTIKLNGIEFLDDWEDWAGKYLPIIPVYGKTAIIEGQHYYRGLVRKARDPQMMYNYTVSAVAEASALTPKDPYWHTKTQQAGHEDEWRIFPKQNQPFLAYNHDPDNPGPPKRTGAPSVQQALVEQMNQARSDVYSTTGIEPSSRGDTLELKSGKAIQAQQAMGDRVLFVFPDNLEKSKHFDALVKIDLIQKLYDTERIEKIINEDGTSEDITINLREYNEINEPIIDEETGEQVIVNDLSKGTYGVVIKSGPKSATRRSETVDQIMRLVGDTPSGEVVASLALDIIVDNMDLNKGEEVKKRIRKWMIEQGTATPTEEEKVELGISDEPPPPDPMNEALVSNLNMQTEKLISEIRNKDADTQSKHMEAYYKSIQSVETLIKALAEKIDAGAPVTPEEEDLLDGAVALGSETVVDVMENQEVADSLPMNAKQQAAENMEQQQIPVPTGPEAPRGPNPIPGIPEGFEEQ
jgi:hypothetical protein